MITSLTEPNWQLIVTIQKLLAGPAGLWTAVVPFVAAPRRLKIEASGSWQPAPTGQPCGPDGQITAPGVAGMLLSSALQGCLIGKVGGSPGDATFIPPSPTPVPGAPFVFSVGSFTTLD